MKTKSVAVEFVTPQRMYDVFKEMNITEFIISDENDALVEIEVTNEQFDNLCNLDDVVYVSEL